MSTEMSDHIVKYAFHGSWRIPRITQNQNFQKSTAIIKSKSKHDIQGVNTINKKNKNCILFFVRINDNEKVKCDTYDKWYHYISVGFTETISNLSTDWNCAKYMKNGLEYI